MPPPTELLEEKEDFFKFIGCFQVETKLTLETHDVHRNILFIFNQRPDDQTLRNTYNEDIINEVSLKKGNNYQFWLCHLSSYDSIW